MNSIARAKQGGLIAVLAATACSVYEAPDGEAGSSPFTTVSAEASGNENASTDDVVVGDDESSSSGLGNDDTTSSGPASTGSPPQTSGPAEPQTCGERCVSRIDCSIGEACLTTTEGEECLAEECAACFAEGRSCSQSAACGFSECGPVNPDFSDTCTDPCTSAADCSAGEACLELLELGMVCVPSGCQGCFDIEQGCTWETTTCAFTGCGDV